MVSLHQPSAQGTTHPLPYILLISLSESRCKIDAGSHKHLLPENYGTVFLTGTRAMTQKGQCKLKGIPYFCIKPKQNPPPNPKHSKQTKPQRTRNNLPQKKLTASINQKKSPTQQEKGKQRKKERKIKPFRSAH